MIEEAKTNLNVRRTIMKNRITQLGIDLAKTVFHICGVDRDGNIVVQQRFRREALQRYLSELPACRIGMEACGGAHHWARYCRARGHDARLIAPKFVKGLVKSNKNDTQDAKAICIAVGLADMRFAPVQTEQRQYATQAHRVRQLTVQQRTAVGNQIRGFLAEFGLVLPQGLHHLRRKLPELLEDAGNGLPPEERDLLDEQYQQLRWLDAKLERAEARIRRIADQDPAHARLRQLPGYGLLTVTALRAKIGDGREFRNGRELAAYLGLVPRQASTGGKPKLLGISKRGDAYLRYLLVHGARAAIRAARRRPDVPGNQWILKLCEGRHPNVAAVALANHNVRRAWAMLASGENYHPPGAPA